MYVHNVVGTERYTTSTTTMYNKDFTYPGQFGLAVGLCRVFKPKHTVHFVTAAAVVAAVGAATAPQQGVRGVAAPSQRPARHLKL